MSKLKTDGIQSNDPAFQQLLNGLSSIPNIDINPYEETEKGQEKKTRANTKQKQVKRKVTDTRARKKSARSIASRRTAVNSNGNLSSIGLGREYLTALAIVEKYYNHKNGCSLRHGEFILTFFEHGLEKMEPELYDVWCNTLDALSLHSPQVAGRGDGEESDDSQESSEGE